MLYRVAFIILSLTWFSLAVNAQAQGDYFIQAEISNPNPYLGQQIRYQFRLFSRVLNITNSGQIIEPSFDGFWLEKMSTQRYQALVEGQAYEVRELNYALFPSRTGSIAIESTVLVIPSQVVFNNPGAVLESESIMVVVQEPPPFAENGSRFDGPVGQFELIPTIDREVTRLGEPIQLQVTIRGNGNVAQVFAPAGLDTAQWRSYLNPGSFQTSELEGQIIGEKTFEWLLTPLEAGQIDLPIITLDFFDPASQSYRSISTSPLTIDVQPAEEAFNVPPPVADTPSLTLRSLPANISLDNPSLPLIFWLLWFGPPLLTLGIWWRVRQEERRRKYAVMYRRSEALKKAAKTLSQVHKQPAVEGYRLIDEAVRHYVADKLDQSASLLNYSDIETALYDHHVQAETRELVMGSLYRSDQARYAPFEAPQPQVLRDQVLKILTRVDITWE